MWKIPADMARGRAQIWGGIRPSPLRLQGWTPSAEHFPLFNRGVAGSFPGQCPVPQLEVHLIKHEARLAPSGGTGGRYSGLGPSPGGTQLWAP